MAAGATLNLTPTPTLKPISTVNGAQGRPWNIVPCSLFKSPYEAEHMARMRADGPEPCDGMPKDKVREDLPLTLTLTLTLNPSGGGTKGPPALRI